MCLPLYILPFYIVKLVEMIQFLIIFLEIYHIRLANCGEYLFQATSDEEMAQWVNAINQVAIQDEGAAGGAGRSQTLPEQGRKDEPKKRSFFTLKKK